VIPTVVSELQDQDRLDDVGDAGGAATEFLALTPQFIEANATLKSWRHLRKYRPLRVAVYADAHREEGPGHGPAPGMGVGGCPNGREERKHVVVSGRVDGPVVMLAHGFGCDQNMWRLVVPALEEHYRVVVFDFVGSGRSDLSAWSRERYASLEGYAQDVLEICRALDLQEVAFVGHSVSAMAGVLASGAEPERFAKMVMVCPSPRYTDDGDYRGGFSRADIEELLESLDSNYLGWSAAMAPVIMGNPGRPELGQELTNSFCATDPDIARVFARTTFLSDSRADLVMVGVPTLVLECSQDVIAPQGVGAFVQASIPGSELVTLDATGHCPQLSAPEATSQAVLSFLGSPR
jgi:sigma-B regulation protein RsbQ